MENIYLIKKKIKMKTRMKTRDSNLIMADYFHFEEAASSHRKYKSSIIIKTIISILAIVIISLLVKKVYNFMKEKTKSMSFSKLVKFN